MTFQALRVTVTQEWPTLVFLIETKKKEELVERVRRRLQFQYVRIVNPRDIVGGLTLLWKKDISVEVATSSPEFLDISFVEPTSGKTMYVTFSHASTNYPEKNEHVELVESHAFNQHLPLGM